MPATTGTLRAWLLATLLLHCVLPLPLARAVEQDPQEIEFFEKRIRPVLVKHCYECHSADSKEPGGNLLLDSRAGLLKGGDSGAALVAGDDENSLLLIAVRQTTKDLRMPPEAKLSEAEIADLAAWIKSGAADPRESSGGNATTTARPGMTLEEGRSFWSYRPIEDTAPPAVKDAAWPRTSVDPFILSRLEQAGVPPAAVADKRTLLRRVTYDLTGLPPTPAEMEAFLADNTPQAFENVIDRLLASPRYGERWGRHWLDVVRYADTCGNASDYPVPQAHKYRDWVIAAFNRDLPYDQFLRLQVAGDLLPSASEEARREQIVATGYLAIARRFGGDRDGEHHLTLEDTIDNLGRAVLGSSIACARCHDHKFDPFTMSDYYGLYGIFSSTRYPFPGAEVGRKQEDFVPLIPSEEAAAILGAHQQQVAAAAEEVKRLEAEQAQANQEPDSPAKTAKLEALNNALAEARKTHTETAAAIPAIDDAYAVVDANPANAEIHVRGDPKRLGDEVARHFPAILGGQSLAADHAASGRLELAHWLTEPANPLTARVMANRIWQHHFGRGLVATPNDFGRQGTPPSHPELLDHLATRFMDSGWSVKAMHKLILLSQTWQLSSTDVADNARLDPQNDLFGRFTRRRLDAESLRDSLLAVSGELDEAVGGPHPFPPPQTWGWTQHNPFVAVYDTQRRSVYLMQQRLRKNPYLALFDGADPSTSVGARLPSTTPLQALFLLNGSLAHHAADRFASRVLASGTDDSARLKAAYQAAFCRSPNEDELQQCTEFLRQYREQLAGLSTPTDQVESQAWQALSRALLSTNEFAFVD